MRLGHVVVASLLGVAACSHGSGGGADQAQLRRIVLDVNGHIVVWRLGGGLVAYRDVVDAAIAIDRDVTVAAPIVLDEVMLAAGDHQQGAVVKGMAPASARRIERYLVQGRLATDAAETPGPAEVVIGSDLARALRVEVGGQITATLPPAAFADPTAEPTEPRTRVMRVVGILHFGFEEYDLRLALATFPTIQDLIGRGDVAVAVELELAHPDAAPRVARALGKRLGDAYEVQDWCQLNGAVLRCP